jgi:hypothetical protein
MSSIVAILIWSTAFLHKTVLLVELFALLAPLRRLVLAILFLFIAFLLSLVNSAAIVFGRAVHSHQLQRLSLRCVNELVLSASGHDDDI